MAWRTESSLRSHDTTITTVAGWRTARRCSASETPSEPPTCQSTTTRTGSSRRRVSTARDDRLTRTQNPSASTAAWMGPSGSCGSSMTSAVVALVTTRVRRAECGPRSGRDNNGVGAARPQCHRCRTRRWRFQCPSWTPRWTTERVACSWRAPVTAARVGRRRLAHSGTGLFRGRSRRASGSGSYRTSSRLRADSTPRAIT